MNAVKAELAREKLRMIRERALASEDSELRGYILGLVTRAEVELDEIEVAMSGWRN